MWKLKKHRGFQRSPKSGLDALRSIALGFAAIIALGGLLLALPSASQTGESIGLFDAMFTSTSAVCVTGLVVRDTGTTFSLFGQIVLLCLIQLGGLGFMTFATLLFRAIGHRSSLRERMLMRESMNEDTLGGLDALVRWVALSAFTVEGIGAALLSVRMIPRFGVGRGIFYSIFHAVSAFCNAGFDLFGNYSSLTDYVLDPIMNFAIMFLIVAGGLGFGVLQDIRGYGRSGKLRLHTKLVLITYGALFAFGCIFTLIAEWNNPQTLGMLNFPQKLQAAMFQSVTLRTAGFNTIDLAALKPAMKLVGSMLMFVGAAPASTGGGVKVTTLAVILLLVRMTVRGEDELVVHHRRLGTDLVRRAIVVTMLSGMAVMFDCVLISLMQPELNMIDILFECASAAGTVGLSAFGTAQLNAISRVLIMLTMYMGRIGPMTLALVLAKRQHAAQTQIHYPEEHIMIG